MRVLFIDRLTGEVSDYFIEQHRRRFRKFLLWDGVLVTGDHDSHEELYESYVLATGRNPGKPCGAGGHYRAPEFDADDVDIWVINSWDSSHFDIYTPSELTPVVNKHLGMTHQGNSFPHNPEGVTYV